MRLRSSFLVLGASFLVAGCDLILGLNDYKEGPEGSGGAGGSATTSASTTTSSTSSVTTTGSSSTSSSSGTTTGSSMMVCEPNLIEKCQYTGTPGTEDHGLCKAGSHRCNPEGTGFDACMGEVTDVAEICGDGDDQDCDGMPDDGCACTPNATTPCYSGPGGTEGVGVCKSGMQTCNAQGTMLGMCTGDTLPGTEVCALGSGDEDCNGLSCSEPKWLVTGGDSNNQHGNLVALDPGGNVYWAGSFSSTITLGTTTLIAAGGYDIFVAKWTPQGTLLWAKRFGGSANETAAALAADASNVYVHSYGGVDFGGGSKQFAKLKGSDGTHVWSKSCSPALSGGGIAVDASGNVIVGSSFTGQNLTCEGGVSMSGNTSGANAGVLLKYSPTGSYLFGKTYVDTSTLFGVEIRAVALDTSGSIWLTGRQWRLSSFGCAGTLGTTNNAAFIVKTDASGACSFQKKYDTGGSYGNAIAVDSLGGPVVVGSFSGSINLTGTAVTATGSSDAFIVKLGATGFTTWGKSDPSDQFIGVDFDENGDVVVSAVAQVQKLAKATGAVLWSTSLGSTGSISPGLIGAGGPENLIFLGGSFTNTGTFGQLMHTSAGSDDAFLLRIDP